MAALLGDSVCAPPPSRPQVAEALALPHHPHHSLFHAEFGFWRRRTESWRHCCFLIETQLLGGFFEVASGYLAMGFFEGGGGRLGEHFAQERTVGFAGYGLDWVDFYFFGVAELDFSC